MRACRKHRPRTGRREAGPHENRLFGRNFAELVSDSTRYVETFLAELEEAKDANDLVHRMWERYPDWRTMAGLRFSASAWIEERDKRRAAGTLQRR